MLSPFSEGNFKYSEEGRRPAVPKQNEKPMMGSKTTKNFVTQNAVENIMSVPKKPEKNMVDTRNGHVMPLEESGLQPKYRDRKVSSNNLEILKNVFS